MTTVLAPTRTPIGERLATLAKLIDLGRGRLSQQLVTETEALLLRAGDRLKLSSEHTVVALAGGTGSGKSSLFNAVSGLELSPTGVRRPTTARAHACVWGLDGAGPLLDWLQVQWRHRFARASALDKGESQLHGLILLDLPDHDSIRALTDPEADRLIGLADVVVWVLDPQKYADAAAHRRYIAERAGAEAVTVFALNQVDRLSREELAELVIDLNDLLRREGVAHPTVVTTSTITGRGVDSLKSVLAEAVSRRRAAVQSLEADLDRLAGKLDTPGEAPAGVDAARRVGLTDALCDAVGVPAIGEAMENSYVERSRAYVGWPVARLLTALRPDPLKALRLTELREEIGCLADAPLSAQPAEVDNAVQALADGLSADLRPAWRASVQHAARGRAEQVPQALSDELAEVARIDRVPGWWRMVRLWHYLLLSGVSAGLLWFVLALTGVPTGIGVLNDLGSLPWVGLGMAVTLLAGALTAVAARGFVTLGAGRERERLELEMRRRVGSVAERMVIEPVERELARHHEYSTALRALK